VEKRLGIAAWHECARGAFGSPVHAFALAFRSPRQSCPALVPGASAEEAYGGLRSSLEVFGRL